MIPIGLGVVLVSYWTGLWGYCLIRGYNVKFTDLAKTTWPGGGGVMTTGAGANPVPTPTGQIPESTQVTQGGAVANATGIFPTITPQGIIPGSG